MADLKISALNSLAGADLVAADVVAVVDDSASETKKLTVSDLIANGTTLISDATIPSAKILFSAGAIDTAELAASAVETAKINDSAVTAAKLADNSSVTLVSTLPASGDFTGQIALDTDDNKIYIWDGSAWDSVKGAGSINVVNGSTSGIVNITTSTSGDTVTVSTTLDDTTAAAQFLAGPTGSAGTVGYRAIIGTDLPAATTTTKGAVIVNGEGLRMDSDTIEIDNDLTANTSTFQAVKFDSKGLITSGRDIASADLPNATDGATGAVKPGTGLEMGTAGAIDHSNSVAAATNTKITYDAQGHVTAGTTLAASDIPDLDTAKVTTGSFATARIADDAITAAKLGDRSTATIAATTPAGGAFIGQTHLNSITGDYFLWDGNVWQPIGISVGEIVLAGTYDASTNLVATVTSEGTAVGYTVGSALPAASTSNKGHYVIVSEAGTGTSPAPTVALNPPDFLLSTGTVYTEIDVSDTVTAQQASNIQFTAAGNIAATNVQSAIEELDTEKVAAANPTFTGTVALGEDAVITFEGATDNAFETTLTVVDPTADRSLSLPNISGTLISSGDTGTVTSTMITDGTIVNADINASAEIAVSKLANGTARQLLQTDSAGTGVEFTSNVDVPGTFDCTGAGTFDSTLTVTGLISADGKVSFPAGTAAAPSFYFGTDTNTGLYHSAADEVAITTGGTQRVVVDSSGDVGIGTSSPAQGPLHVHSSTTNAYFHLTNSTTGSAGSDGFSLFVTDNDTVFNQRESANMRFFTANSERLRIDSSGRLLVGTSSANGSGGAEFEVAKQTMTTSDMGLASFQLVSNSSRWPQVFIEKSRGSAVGDKDLVSDGDSLGELAFRGSDGTNYLTGASIIATVNGTPGTNDLPTDLRFSTTADGAASSTERLRIDSSGRVGIGTTSPSYKLDVNGSAQVRAGESLHFQNVAGSGIASIQCAGAGTNTDLSFKTATTERMRIDSSGRLLHGTSAAGTGAFGTVPFFHAASISSANVFQNYGATTFPARIDLCKTRGTSANSHVVVQNNDTVGGIYFSGSDGTDYAVAASIEGIVNGTPGNNDMPGLLRFLTTPDGAQYAVERVRIDSSGNVGIGTTSAGTRLQVEGTPDAASATLRITATGECSAGVSCNSTGTVIGTDTGGILFKTGVTANTPTTTGSERVRIDSSGRLLVNASSSTQVGSIDAKAQIVSSDFNAALAIRRNQNGDGGPAVLLCHSRGTSNSANVVVQENDNLGQIRFFGADNTGSNDFAEGAAITASVDGTPGNDDMPTRLEFKTCADGASSPTERMRIANSGETFITSVQSSLGISSVASAGTTYALIIGRHSGTAGSHSSGTQSFRVFTNGNVQNTNNSYGAISDVKLKENIVDASSQWDDIKDIRIRNYNFIEGQTHTQIGVVAQEVETVSPGLVTESPDFDDDNNDLGTVTKSVNYSVLYMKAVKALQEAMERIETLEAKVAALEAE